MAITTAGIYLGYAAENTTLSANTTFTKVCDITTFPDMLSAPDTIDSTTLSALVNKTYEADLADTSDMAFEANWDKAKFSALQAIKGENKLWCLVFVGDSSLITWKAKAYPTIAGGGVSEIVRMGVSMAVTDEVKLETSWQFDELDETNDTISIKAVT